MRCVVCDHNEWENVDKYRLKKEGMAICKHCGFISYPDKWQDEEAIKAYYRKTYRPGPKIQNWHSGQRKLHFHNSFLKPLFDKWKAAGIEKPVVGEVGAAYGLFLNFVRDVYPGAEVHGTELTLSYRRNAYHEFGIELTEDFNDQIKYDLIASYKVAEHQCDVDKLLIKYKEALKPDGHLYISVPTWFGKLYNFGAGGFDLEYYYSPNHINVWTRKLFEVVLRKCGLKVLKVNDTMYDETYLCVRDDSLMAGPFEYENYEEMIQKLQKVKEAGLAFTEGDFEKAIAAWPNFPDAHGSLYEGSRAQVHKLGIEGVKAVIERAIKDCKGAPEVLCLAADLNMRYDRWEDAIKLFERVLALRPGFSPAIKGISQCLRQIGHKALRESDFPTAFEHLEKAREVARFLRKVSAADEYEAVNWCYDDNSRIPMPSEIGN